MTCRRGAIVAVLAVLAAPAASAAPIATFKGATAGDGNSKVTFKVVKNDRGKRRVDVPRGRQLDAICDKGPQEIDVRFGSGLRNAKVGADGTFEFDNSGKGYTAYFNGRITGRSATGVLRYQGVTDFEKGPQTCETGELKWDAEKV